MVTHLSMAGSVVVQTKEIFGRLVGSFALLVPLVDVVSEVQLLMLKYSPYQNGVQSLL